MRLGERIAIAKEKIAVSQYAKEEYIKQINSAVEKMIIACSTLPDESKGIIQSYCPEYLDREHLESIKLMSYEELQVELEKLGKVTEEIVVELERLMKCG